MRADRQRPPSREGDRDEAFRGEQTLGLDLDAGERPRQLRQGERRVGVPPATDQAELRPDLGRSLGGQPRERLHQQQQEARMPDRDHGEVAAPQQVAQGGVAEGVRIAQVPHRSGDGQRGVDQPAPEAAQVLRILLETHAHGAGGPFIVERERRDRPVGAPQREARPAGVEVDDPGRDRPADLPLQLRRVGDELGRRRGAAGGLQGAHGRAGEDAGLSGGDPLHPRRHVLPEAPRDALAVLLGRADRGESMGASEGGVGVGPEISAQQVALGSFRIGQGPAEAEISGEVGGEPEEVGEGGHFISHSDCQPKGMPPLWG